MRWLTDWSWLLRLRRRVGLFCFFYASLHVTAYVGLDQWFGFAAIARDIVKRPYITIGLTAYLLLIPLAATSTDAMVRKLGGRNWQRLHRANYFVAPLAVLHFWWQNAAKNNIGGSAIFAVLVGALLGVRALRCWH